MKHLLCFLMLIFSVIILNSCVRLEKTSKNPPVYPTIATKSGNVPIINLYAPEARDGGLEKLKIENRQIEGCSQIKDGLCIACIQGYYIVNNYCLRIVEGCWYYSMLGCMKCLEGHYGLLDKNELTVAYCYKDNKIPNCKQQFVIREGNRLLSVCETCDSGYYRGWNVEKQQFECSRQSCIMPGCEVFDTYCKTCLRCNMAEGFSSDGLGRCKGVPCDVSKKENYLVKKNQVMTCSKCSENEGTLTCTSSFDMSKRSDLTCKLGYGLLEQEFNRSTCTACSSFYSPDCLECGQFFGRGSEYAVNCTKCKPGLYIVKQETIVGNTRYQDIGMCRDESYITTKHQNCIFAYKSIASRTAEQSRLLAEAEEILKSKNYERMIQFGYDHCK